MGVIFLSGLLVFGLSPVGIGLAAVVTNSVLLAVFGFVGGAAFSTVLGITEGRRRFDEMSLPRFAGLGAVGGLLTSVLVGGGGGWFILETLVFVGVVTLLGAGSAAGSLALARRAEDREFLESGEEALGLIEAESPHGDPRSQPQPAGGHAHGLEDAHGDDDRPTSPCAYLALRRRSGEYAVAEVV